MNTLNTQLHDAKNTAYELYKLIRDLEVLQAQSESGGLSPLQALMKAVASGDYVVLDSETTGLGKGDNKDALVEIAIVDASGKALMNQRIKPPIAIPETVIKIHGISDLDVIGCPELPDILPLIKGHIAGKYVLVFNAVFDRKILHQHAELCGLPPVNYKAFSNWVCVMEAFQEYLGMDRWQSLKSAAQHFEIEQSNAHSALGDALTTLEVVKAMAESD